MEQKLFVTYWYESGRQIVMSMGPGEYGRFIGTLELTLDELREAHVVAWETRDLAGAEATAKRTDVLSAT